MNIFLYIVGILISVAVLVIAIGATVLGYLAYCSKHPMRKLRAEIFIVISACIISLVIRMAIGFAATPKASLTGGVESFLYGILSTVAGLMFDAPAELSSFEFVNGFLVCMYYGLIAYVGFVFLAVITVGVSYEVYSSIQTWFVRFRKHCTYYIITSVNQDTLVLAENIKKIEKKKKGHSHVIIFYENGENAFSRKNPLHRKLMSDGFYYFSDPRCKDNGDTVSFLKKFKFKKRHCVKDDVAENHGKLFYVFAFDNSGDYESCNADVVFDDVQATLEEYVGEKQGISQNGLPTVLNYYVLTSGRVNFESYDRRLKETVDARIEKLPEAFYWDGKGKKPKNLYDYVDSQIQINVVSEATLSAHSLVLARKARLNELGDEAFERDAEPDGNGAYRVAVIGFGRTGVVATEELYTHTAKLIKTENGYTPVQFIADIYDLNIDEKSGIFAYNHPLFRCINDKSGNISPTADVLATAKTVGGEAFGVLYSEYREQSGKTDEQARDFIDKNMSFPIAVMHKGNCFGYPFLSGMGTETAVAAAAENNVRDFVVALGNDERNIEMANMIIDSFRRLFLNAELAGKNLKFPHVKIYVNIIDSRNKSLINWRWGVDEQLFTRPYGGDERPRLSVIPFGFREEMYSYETFVEDYRERIYNYGYTLLTDIIEAEKEHKAEKQRLYDQFRDNLNKDYNYYRNSEEVIDKWMTLSQYLRLSNRSALDFSINYYKYKQLQIKNNLSIDKDFLTRLEHERWNRFFISHGWVYARYYKHLDKTGLTKEEIDEAKKKEKNLRRQVRHHNCICPFDEMLDEYTKDYDRGNVELGFIRGIVFGEEKAKKTDGGKRAKKHRTKKK